MGRQAGARRKRAPLHARTNAQTEETEGHCTTQACATPSSFACNIDRGHQKPSETEKNSLMQHVRGLHVQKHPAVLAISPSGCWWSVRPTCREGSSASTVSRMARCSTTLGEATPSARPYNGDLTKGLVTHAAALGLRAYIGSPFFVGRLASV